MTVRVAERQWPWLHLGSAARPFATGPAASVRADGAGLLEVRIGDHPPVMVETPLAGASRARVSPCRFERTGAGLIERFDVLPDRAALVGAWFPADARSTVTGLRLVLTMPAPVVVTALDGTRLGLRIGGGGLSISADRPVEWNIEAGTERCTIAVRTMAPVRLAFGATDRAGRPARAVDPVLHDPALGATVVDAAIARMRATGLHVSCAEPVIGDAFAWARARLADSRPTRTVGQAWHIMALLAAGDHDAAYDRLLALAPGETLPDASAFALAHARAVAWTGRTDALVTQRDALVKALGKVAEVDVVTMQAAGTGGSASDSALVVAAQRTGAVLAESMSGQAGIAALLASRARRAGPAPADTVHGADTRPAIELARQQLEDGRIRSGVRLLLDSARSVMAEVAAGELTLDAAAAMCAAVVPGLLGADPDAIRGRLVLRPRIDGPLLPFNANGIRVGEAELALGVTQEDGVWALEVEQTAGAVPLQLVLEPWIGAPAFADVRIDGRPAGLEARPADGGWILPVQLVPDRARRMDVLLVAKAGPP